MRKNHQSKRSKEQLHSQGHKAGHKAGRQAGRQAGRPQEHPWEAWEAFPTAQTIGKMPGKCLERG